MAIGLAMLSDPRFVLRNDVQCVVQLRIGGDLTLQELVRHRFAGKIGRRRAVSFVVLCLGDGKPAFFHCDLVVERIQHLLVILRQNRFRYRAANKEMAEERLGENSNRCRKRL